MNFKFKVSFLRNLKMKMNKVGAKVAKMDALDFTLQTILKLSNLTEDDLLFTLKLFYDFCVAFKFSDVILLWH
jgi:hypothetical protein